MDEELDYVSSSPLVGAKREVVPEDEAKLSTLVRISRLIDEQLSVYHTISSLNLSDKNFTVEQQLAINKQVVLHLLEVKTLVETAIDNIEEAHRE